MTGSPEVTRSPLGGAAIRARHSCAHRAEELLGVLRGLGADKEKIAG